MRWLRHPLIGVVGLLLTVTIWVRWSTQPERCIPVLPVWNEMTCDGDIPWLVRTPCENGNGRWVTRTCNGKGVVEETWDE